MADSLLIDRAPLASGSVETWTLNDPASRNALSEAMVDALLTACERAVADADLRGVVLPVIDLKARLGREPTEANPKHVIVVVEAADRTIGILVDAVSDILTVTEADLQPTPELARDAGTLFVEGIAVLDARMVTILSMERLIASLVGSGLKDAA